MCGRVLYNHRPHELLDYLDLLEMHDELTPRYNVAPTDPVPVVSAWGRLEVMRWGLTTLANRRATGINARRESLGLYAGTSRALVVVSGFYEWRALGGRRKQPFLIHRRDQQPLVLAGIADDAGVAIVTCPARGIVGRVHDRMPAILEREAFRAWLDAGERAAPILDRVSADALTMHAVSNDVGDVRNDRAGLIEPVEERRAEPDLQLEMFGAGRSR